MTASRHTPRPEVPIDVGRPFTRAAGLATGLTDRDLNGAAYRRLLRGTYVHADTPKGPHLWAGAALLLAPDGSFATHHTAARLLGAPVPDSSTVHLGTVSGLASAHQGLRLHRYAALPPLVERHGIPCTDAIQTGLDLAAVLDLVDLVVFLDAILAAGAVSLEGVRRATENARSRGARRARRAAALARERVESATESRVRMLFVLAGLPEPVVNLAVHSSRTGRGYRLDLAWPDYMVAVEYDGRHHIERPEQWHADLARREDLEGMGWRIIVLTARDLFTLPAATLARVAGALHDAGMPVRPLRDEWERHFGRAWRYAS